MKCKPINVVLSLCFFLLISGCEPELIGKCLSNDECIDGYLCNKDEQCVQVEQENIEILTNSLDDAVVGEAYSKELSLRGGLAPYAWSIVTGPGWLHIIKDANTSNWRLIGTTDTYQKDEMIVELEVTDSSIDDGHKATKDNLSIRVLYCLESEGPAEACSGQGTCDTDGVCECSVGHAGDQCGDCDQENGYELNSKGECVKYKYNCEPDGVCGANVLECECIGEDCEEVEDCEIILDCNESSVCFVDGGNYGCDDCQGTGCTNGACVGCSEGECCNSEGKIIPDTEVCDSWTEYQCSSVACGASAQLRSVEQFCSGTTSDCTGEKVPDEEWSTIQQCNEFTERCETDGNKFAMCSPCTHGCLDGECRDCSNITFNDGNLEVKVRQAIGKAEGDILYEDILELTE